MGSEGGPWGAGNVADWSGDRRRKGVRAGRCRGEASPSVREEEKVERVREEEKNDKEREIKATPDKKMLTPREESAGAGERPGT